MRILIVEDEHKIAAALKRGLEQEHYAVDLAYDGKEGMGFALTEPYDLIILDRMIPGISDGLEICKEVRKKGLHLPILVLTAKDQPHERVLGLDSGADDYLIKPFAFEEFLARVRALLRRPEQRVETILQSEDLSLNTITYEVTRKGKLISLSIKEYALLEYLLRNKGKTVSKDAIISHVWDYDADILPNTVEVYIGYLRNKIDKPFKGRSLIKTVRGFGYKLGV
ncbi:MAG: two component transcriptional regulator, winged helix family protein [Patescibacteria group bacterium]|jgi:DNA-binding response OmpR family regulator|nr:two component transcriptional regulator, winged helix family protein [Patescibacteria group bacterium]